MNDTPHTSPLDAIRHEDEQGKEYWSARELYKILGYTEWCNFNSTVIKRAIKSCEENGRAASEHIVQSYKLSRMGQGGKRPTDNYHLTRYACYLTLINGDPKCRSSPWARHTSRSRLVARRSLTNLT